MKRIQTSQNLKTQKVKTVSAKNSSQNAQDFPVLDGQDLHDLSLLARWQANSRNIRNDPAKSTAFEDLLSRRIKDSKNTVTSTLHRTTYFGADKAEQLFNEGKTNLNKYPAYSFTDSLSVARDFYDKSQSNHSRAVISVKATGLDMYRTIDNIVENIAKTITRTGNPELLNYLQANVPDINGNNGNSKQKQDTKANRENNVQVFNAYKRWLLSFQSNSRQRIELDNIPEILKRDYGLYSHVDEREIIVPRGLPIKSSDVKEFKPDADFLAKVKSNPSLIPKVERFEGVIESLSLKDKENKDKKKDKDKKGKDKDKKGKDKKEKGKDKDKKDKKDKDDKPGQWFFDMTLKQRKKYLEEHEDSKYEKWLKKKLP